MGRFFRPLAATGLLMASSALATSAVKPVAAPAMHLAAAASCATGESDYSWDPGLFATHSADCTQVHAWGTRQSPKYWGTGPVNYQSGDTRTSRAAGWGTLSFDMAGTYCGFSGCTYGNGSGYKGLVQLWNDQGDYIAFGLIHDPGVSPTGMTVMVEGAGSMSASNSNVNGNPVGGYWANNAVTGSTHHITVSWGFWTGVTFTLDGTQTLGAYPVHMSYPSVSFLAAARGTGDTADTTFSNIAFSEGSNAFQTVSGTPLVTCTDTLTSAATNADGYSAFINIHDNNSNAIAVGIQADSSDPVSQGAPWIMIEEVQGGIFTFDYVQVASNSATTVQLEWWPSNQAELLVNGTEVATFNAHLVPRLFFQVEGDARQNGDAISDTFGPVSITTNGPAYNGNTIWNAGNSNSPLNGSWNTGFSFAGLHATNTNGQSENGAAFTVTGTVSGLTSSQNWDNTEIAGIGMIAQYWNGQ